MRSRQQRLKTRSLRRRFLVLVGETEPGEQRESAHGENGDQGASAEDVANVPHCARGIRNRGESPGRSAQEEQEVAGGANGVEENGEVPVAKRQSIEDGGATPEIEREELVENVSDRSETHGEALRQDSKDQRPPSMVRSTGMVTRVEGFSRRGSRPRTTRSASFPGLIEPLLFSSYVAYAPLRVPTRTASSMEIRWLAPQTLPWVSVRVTWDCSAVIGSKGLAV